MQVTATEFKLNLGKYLELVLTEDIWMTKNVITIAKLINPNASSVDAISGILAGKVPADLNRHATREKRQTKYAIDDGCQYPAGCAIRWKNFYDHSKAIPHTM